MRGWRLLRLIAVFAVFGAAAPGAALACDEPALALLTPRAAAGDPVPFSVVNLEPGASVTVSVAGRQVFSGSAAEESLAGSFSMPDLGGPATVYVEAYTAHDDGTWPSTQPLVFVAPQAAPARPEAQADPAPEPKGASAGEGTAEPEPRAAPAPAAATPAAPVAEAQAPVRKSTPAAAPRPERAPRLHEPRDVPLPVATSVQAAPRAEPAPAVVTSADGGGHGAFLPSLVAAALLAAAALAGVVRRRRRDARIESELQELIAEARAAAACDAYRRKGRYLGRSTDPGADRPGRATLRKT